MSLFHSLAIRGAQIIALHPNPSAENVVQILYLLRATSENERIYVDECDMTDIGSIREFVQVWEKGIVSFYFILREEEY